MKSWTTWSIFIILFFSIVLFVSIQCRTLKQRKRAASKSSKFLPCKVFLDPDGNSAIIQNGFIQATVSTKDSMEISDIRADFTGRGDFFDKSSVVQKPIRVFAHWVPGSIPSPLPATSNISVALASSSAAQLIAWARIAGEGSEYSEVEVTASFTVSLGRRQVIFFAFAIQSSA